MALDEVLLKSARTPLLRRYRWSEPAVSFGYFSRYDEALAFAAGRALVRRWTGGGIVAHGDDLTYSLIIPSSDGTYTLPSSTIYSRVHGALVTSLQSAGVRASLALENCPREGDICFANPVIADVMQSGRKIAGAAHRKSGAGLLHQGSIQCATPDDPFVQDFTRNLAHVSHPENLGDTLVAEAQTLARDKYASDAWLHRR
ncbi:MAG: lipoate--protein ligase family protein [Verrucomicrobia bacterium]|nr:lipoate--protein ligase family protein [Verrucomicrobiota bacterium]